MTLIWYRLLSTIEPGIELVEPTKKKEKPAKQVEYFKGIDASLIMNNSEKSERDFMGTLHGYGPSPSDWISLAPCVNFSSNGRQIIGPDMERANRMTLDEYYVISNQNNQVRYDKDQFQRNSEPSQIVLQGKFIKEWLSNAKCIVPSDTESSDGNLDHVGFLKSKFKRLKGSVSRPRTAFKDKSRIIGDFEKAKMLQNTIVGSKKVNFNAFQTESSIHSQLKRVNSSKSNFNVSRPQTARIKSITKKQPIRPQTAKDFYTQKIEQIRMRKSKERVMPLKVTRGSKIMNKVYEYKSNNSKV